MLRGPLTELLQTEQNGPGRAIACDCVGSIGERTFVKLPVKKPTIIFNICIALPTMNSK